MIDLRGRTLMPGIHDGHTHPLAGGLALTKPTLNYRKLDLAPFIAAIRKLLERSADQEPDGWLSVDLWEPLGMDRQPTKEDLDRLPTRRPIIVIDLSGHTAVVNSRALELAGITASTPDPRGGEIGHRRNGEPTGILLDSAIGLVTAKIPPLTTEQNADALEAAHKEIAKRGSRPTSTRRSAPLSWRRSRPSRTADRSPSGRRWRSPSHPAKRRIRRRCWPGWSA